MMIGSWWNSDFQTRYREGGARKGMHANRSMVIWYLHCMGVRVRVVTGGRPAGKASKASELYLLSACRVALAPFLFGNWTWIPPLLRASLRFFFLGPSWWPDRTSEGDVERERNGGHNTRELLAPSRAPPGRFGSSRRRQEPVSFFASESASCRPGLPPPLWIVGSPPVHVMTDACLARELHVRPWQQGLFSCEPDGRMGCIERACMQRQLLPARPSLFFSWRAAASASSSSSLLAAAAAACSPAHAPVQSC